MIFNTGSVIEQTENGILPSIQQEIACDCWFTSTGRSIPRTIKVMDTHGRYHVFRNIRVLYSEEKVYSGIPTVEHLCQFEIYGKLVTVKLIFTKETCRWSITKP